MRRSCVGLLALALSTVDGGEEARGGLADQVFIYGMAAPQMAAQLVRFAALAEGAAQLGARVAEPFVHADAHAYQLRGWAHSTVAHLDSRRLASESEAPRAQALGGDDRRRLAQAIGTGANVSSLSSVGSAFALTELYEFTSAHSTFTRAVRLESLSRALGGLAAIDLAVCWEGSPDEVGSSRERSDRPSRRSGGKRRRRRRDTALADAKGYAPRSERDAVGAPSPSDRRALLASDAGAEVGGAEAACISATGSRANRLCSLALREASVMLRVRQVLCIAHSPSVDVSDLFGSHPQLRAARSILWLNPHRQMFGAQVERRAWQALLGMRARGSRPPTPPAFAPAAWLRAHALASSSSAFGGAALYVALHFRLERMGCKAAKPGDTRCEKLSSCAAAVLRLALVQRPHAGSARPRALLFTDLLPGGTTTCEANAGTCRGLCCASAHAQLVAAGQAARMQVGGLHPRLADNGGALWAGRRAKPQQERALRSRLCVSLLDAELMANAAVRVHVGGGYYGFWVTALQRCRALALSSAEEAPVAEPGQELLRALKNESGCRRVVVSYRPRGSGAQAGPVSSVT